MIVTLRLQIYKTWRNNNVELFKVQNTHHNVTIKKPRYHNVAKNTN